MLGFSFGFVLGVFGWWVMGGVWVESFSGKGGRGEGGGRWGVGMEMGK